MELISIAVLTVLFIPLVLLTSGWLRVVLGLLFVLLFPGYTLMAAVFPRKDSLDSMERVAFSFGFSAAIVPVIGMVLNYTPLGIGIYTVVISIALFVLVASAIAIWRRRRLPKEERFHTLPQISASKWHQLRWQEKVLSITLVLSILVATGAAVYVVFFPKLGEKFTEFYFLSEEGYPGELTEGEPLTVELRIVNHEHADTTYHLQAIVDGEVVQQTEPFSLAHDETKDETVVVVFTEAGPQQKVEFLLYKDDGADPYLSLYLSVSVAEAKP